jgi:hypothetical protein
MLRRAYAIVAVALTISANHWQPPPPDVPTSADLVLWQDAFGGEMTKRFAIVQATIRPDNLKANVRQALDSTNLTPDERALIEKLIQRNASFLCPRRLRNHLVRCSSIPHCDQSILATTKRSSGSHMRLDANSRGFLFRRFPTMVSVQSSIWNGQAASTTPVA